MSEIFRTRYHFESTPGPDKFFFNTDEKEFVTITLFSRFCIHYHIESTPSHDFFFSKRRDRVRCNRLFLISSRVLTRDEDFSEKRDDSSERGKDKKICKFVKIVSYPISYRVNIFSKRGRETQKNFEYKSYCQRAV